MASDVKNLFVMPAEKHQKKIRPIPQLLLNSERRELQIDLCETTARIAIVHFASCGAVLLYHQDVAERPRILVIVRTGLPQSGTQPSHRTRPTYYHLQTDTWFKGV